MRPERALAKLAPAAGMRQGSGGIPEYTAADIAAALAFCPDRVATLLVLYVWAGQSDLAQPLERAVYLMAVDRAARESWTIPKGREYVRKMARLAILETVGQPKCSRCNGYSKEFTREDGEIDCRVCGGEGSRSLRDDMRAEIVGMHKSRWSRVWGPRYEQIMGDVRDKIAKGLRHVADRMG